MRYIWNTTKNKLKIQYDAKTWFMEPNEVKEFYFDQDAKSIYDNYAIEGIALLERNDDNEKQEKLKSATERYYGFLLQQLRDWSSYMDDMRKDGRSIMGIPKRVKELQKEVATMEYANGYELSMNDEIYEKLIKDGVIKAEQVEPWIEPLKAKAPLKEVKNIRFKNKHEDAEIGA